MAGYNFDEAYSTDSFTDSDWEAICGHVGVNFADTEEGGNSETENRKGEESMEGKSETDSEEKKNVEIEKGNELEESNSEQTEDKISELRKDMKDMRKTLKKGRVQLLNWDKTDIGEVEETYRQLKKDAKTMKKKFKALLYSNDENCSDKRDLDKGAKTTVDAGESSSKYVEKGGKNTVDSGASYSVSKPVYSSFQGQQRYCCPSCDFIGRSFRRTYSHMVKEHNAKHLECDKCDNFTTKNPTSLHNHRKLYCSKKNK